MIRFRALQFQALLAALAALLVACTGTGPQRPAMSAEQATAFSRFPAPERGARLYVSMGVIITSRAINERGMTEGELFINGQAVDKIGNRGELIVVDLPAGSHTLTWLPANSLDRLNAVSRPSRLALADGEVRHVMLDVTLKTGAAAALGSVAARVATSYATELSIDPRNPRMAERQPLRHLDLRQANNSQKN